MTDTGQLIPITNPESAPVTTPIGTVGGWPTLVGALGFEVELAGAPPFAIRSKEWAVSAAAAVAASSLSPHPLAPPRPSSLTPDQADDNTAILNLVDILHHAYCLHLHVGSRIEIKKRRGTRGEGSPRPHPSQKQSRKDGPPGKSRAKSGSR
jgi:hypothetical protein